MRDELPPHLAAIPPEKIVEIDVREDLRSGKEPFSRIMAARAEVSEGGALSLRAIFEPVPLYTVLGKQGFLHHTEQLGDEDWRVWFYRPLETDVSAASGAARASDASGPFPRASDSSGTSPDRSADQGAGSGAGPQHEEGGDIVVLDVRDLEPPEPMVRTLAALETLPEEQTLLHINRRVPLFLLPQLEERGFDYEIREQEPGLVRVFIRRAPTSPDSDST